MIEYKGLYTIDSNIGKFAFNYFEGDNSGGRYTFNTGENIQGSTLADTLHSGAVSSVNSPVMFDSLPLVKGQYPFLWWFIGVSSGPRFISMYSSLTNSVVLPAVFKNTITGVYYFNNIFINAGDIRDYEVSSEQPTASVFGFVVAHLLKPKNIDFTSLSSLDNTAQYSTVQAIFDSLKPWQTGGDPYTDGGESDIGGGTGNFDGTSVDVDFTPLPTLSAVDTGFISLYNPTLAQLQSLANYMWSDLFDLDTFKKLFGDPMQAILGLSIVPGPVPSAGSQAVKVGNISTGINMTKAASQYIDIDCGTLNVEEFWGAYLDYEPYTKAEIYLPYIGTHQIAVDDIMGKAVHIKYHIDILSGACAAEIKCGGSVLYTFIGSVAVSIPITGNDWTNVINGVLSIAGAVGSLVATGGATAPAAAGEIASAAVNSLKPNIEKSGSVSGGGGLMAGKVPVLILTRPRQALPASQNSFTGYPAFITRSLGAVSGYTEVHKIRLGGISATDAELDEIENLLKGGVIL